MRCEPGRPPAGSPATACEDSRTAAHPLTSQPGIREEDEVERQQDYVLRTVEERGVRFVQLWFTDVLGTPKHFDITPAELEDALEEGMTFDGSAIDGFSRVQESDMLAKPDAKTFQLLPRGTDTA